MQVINQKYEIKAPLYAVWKTLVDPKLIKIWSGEKAVMTEEKGKEFSLWGGYIHGKNLKVLKGKELQQEWISDNWEKPSIVTFALDEGNGVTTVYLYQKDVPDEDTKDIEDGWKKYYFEPITKLLEKDQG